MHGGSRIDALRSRLQLHSHQTCTNLALFKPQAHAHLHRAQFLDSGLGDGWGVVTADGWLKPAFHAFYLYARMPEQQRALRWAARGRAETPSATTHPLLTGFTSSNASFVAVAIWSTSANATTLRLDIEPLPFPAARATLRVFRIDSAHYSAPTRNFIQPLAEGNAAAVGARASLRGMHWEGVVEPFSLLHFEVEIPDDCA